MSELSVGQLKGLTVNNNIITVPSGHNLVQPGMLLQLLTSRSGPARQVISSTSPVAVDGLSITMTPKFSNSLIFIQAQVSTNAPYVWSLGIFKDGVATVNTSGQTNSNEPNMQVTGYWGTDSTDSMYTVPVIHYEIANSTTQRTYQVYATSAWSGSTRSMQINNRNSNDMASFSHIVVMEIAQ